ncbi:MAG: hydantoinase B/oxoprolinase family protein [Victivallales bacterium]|nr:hydantoinase B/oxoprolinase family protein [Victivallales bacterium]MCF7889365.1 hydantoinase B/oxoprolinase family protein [Victivallales bacterium]
MTKEDVDPITLEVMRNAFQSIAEEMGAALIRTALSTNIKDRGDFSTAVYSPKGDLIAQAEHIPLHLGLMPSVVKSVLKKFPVKKLKQGDAVVTNDPYVSGSHLPDVSIITPLFYKGKLTAILANLAHHIDVGGITPCSMPANSTEIFQEGIRIPPVKIKNKGKMNYDILELIINNVRTKEECYGDFFAQLAANSVGEKRLIELADKYSPEKLLLYMDAINGYAEKRMAANIEKLPEGNYFFKDYLEGDGITDKLIKIQAEVSVKKNSVTVDFTGTEPQVKGSVNCTRPVTLACVYFAVKSVVDPTLPSSTGAYEPIKVITPAGSLVNPLFPAAVANANINTAQRVADVVLGALSIAVPEKVPAASAGSMNNFTIGGIHPDTGDYYSYVETYGGGQGAMFNLDGMDGVHTNMTNTGNAPVEVIETSYPLRVEKYSLVKDSEGPGKFRGGLGLCREITVLGHEAKVSLSSEREKIKPWGLAGGKSPKGSECTVILPCGKEKQLPIKFTGSIISENRIRLQTAGGGGNGNPFEREASRVLNDFKQGFISIQRAKKEYGAVIDPDSLTVDKEKTDNIRRKITY